MWVPLLSILLHQDLNDDQLGPLSLGRRSLYNEALVAFYLVLLQSISLFGDILWPFFILFSPLIGNRALHLRSFSIAPFF